MPIDWKKYQLFNDVHLIQSTKFPSYFYPVQPPESLLNDNISATRQPFNTIPTPVHAAGEFKHSASFGTMKIFFLAYLKKNKWYKQKVTAETTENN